MADRIGVINKGEIILVEDKAALMRKLGKKQLTLQLQQPARRSPAGARRPTARARRGRQRARLHLRRAGREHRHRRAAASSSSEPGIDFKDLQTSESSLEEIFVSLVRQTR